MNGNEDPRHGVAAGSGDSYAPLASPGSGGAAFNTTHWSVVLLAVNESSGAAQAALENLCHAYWYPLYVYVRRRGHSPHDAQDLTQSFFVRLLDKNFLSGVDRTKGKFRSFLLAALEHFLANDWRRSQAQKRGGGARFISLDDELVEEQYLQLRAEGISAEKIFERQWAATLLEHVLTQLRVEFVEARKEAFFAELKIFLTGEKRTSSYSELALKLGTSEAALKMAVSRMRRRYSELLRDEIAKTVSGPEQVEEELQALFAALS